MKKLYQALITTQFENFISGFKHKIYFFEAKSFEEAKDFTKNVLKPKFIKEILREESLEDSEIVLDYIKVANDVEFVLR